MTQLVALFVGLSNTYSLFMEIKKLFDKFLVAYITYKDNKFDADITAAIGKMFSTGNQIDLEKLQGYSKAGEESKHEGAIVVDKLPTD